MTRTRTRLQHPNAIIRTSQAVPPTMPVPDSTRTDFDAQRAFSLLCLQCERGPRVPGSEGHTWLRQLIVEQLGLYADEIGAQQWQQKVNSGPGAGGTFALTNLFAIFHGLDSAHPFNAPADLMLSAHWDTRPVADNDPDVARRAEPVPGANDGASGVAVLLEMARVLATQRPQKTIVLAFWDGEDFGEYYYGSRLFANIGGGRQQKRWTAREGILLDMVGNHPLRCTTEGNSLKFHPRLWDEIHNCAAELGLEHHFHGPKRTISDDHVFLTHGGIPTILLIDYSYPHWHTTSDTADKCSAESLGIIGDVLQRFVGSDPSGMSQ